MCPSGVDQFTAQEAREAAVAVCNLALENWPPLWSRAKSLPDDFLVNHDLVNRVSGQSPMAWMISYGPSFEPDERDAISLADIISNQNQSRCWAIYFLLREAVQLKTTVIGSADAASVGVVVMRNRWPSADTS